MTPQTLSEWAEYVNGLPPEILYEKAQSANTVSFVQALQDEGLPPGGITAILRLFAKRMVALGIDPPGKSTGSYLDYHAMLEQDRLLKSVFAEGE